MNEYQSSLNGLVDFGPTPPPLLSDPMPQPTRLDPLAALGYQGQWEEGAINARKA
jgi:hypothetical protein